MLAKAQLVGQISLIIDRSDLSDKLSADLKQMNRDKKLR